MTGSLQQECQADNERAMSGFVIQVGDASFRMLVDAQVFNVNYSDCTMGLSNIKDYSLIPGDIAVVKGEMMDDKTLQATYISTLRH